MNNLKEGNKNILATLNQFISYNGWLLFLLFCLLTFLFLFLKTEFVITDQLYDQHVQEQMHEKYDNYDELTAEFEEDLEDLEESESQVLIDRLMDFAMLTLQYILQFGIISSFIYVALAIANGLEGTNFQMIFKIALVSEFVFFIPKTLKYLWFIVKENSYSYKDVQDFNPFSLYGLFAYSYIPDWLAYPLKFLNLFEAIYLLILVAGLSLVTTKEMSKIAVPVVLSYLTLMVIWISIRIYLNSIL